MPKAAIVGSCQSHGHYEGVPKSRGWSGSVFADPSSGVHGQATRFCDALGLDQAAADCVACEVDAVAHAELGEDVGAVAFDGFDAENERRCDFL